MAETKTLTTYGDKSRKNDVGIKKKKKNFKKGLPKLIK